MQLTNADQVRNAINDEFGLIREGDAPLPERDVDDMVEAILAMPEEMRAEYVTNFVRDIVDRRRGDPRT